MNRLAIISNPKSHRNLRGSAMLSNQSGCDFFVGFAEPDTQAELLAMLIKFKQAGANIIAINGGDGTVRDVLTALWQVDPQWRPALCLIPGGKTNMIAHDVGCAMRAPAGLRQILDAASKGQLNRNKVSRPVLDIIRSDDPGPPICGMFFGAGAFSRGTELAQSEANALGLYQGLAVAFTIASMLMRTLRGKAGENAVATLTADNIVVQDGPQFILLATSARRIIMGLKPFWGPQTGAIRYTVIDGPPVRLISALLPILRGRPKPWMQAAGYHSGSADHLSVRLTSHFTVDGELFDPGPRGLIELSARRYFDFVYP